MSTNKLSNSGAPSGVEDLDFEQSWNSLVQPAKVVTKPEVPGPPAMSNVARVTTSLAAVAPKLGKLAPPQKSTVVQGKAPPLPVEAKLSVPKAPAAAGQLPAVVSTVPTANAVAPPAVAKGPALAPPVNGVAKAPVLSAPAAVAATPPVVKVTPPPVVAASPIGTTVPAAGVSQVNGRGSPPLQPAPLTAPSKVKVRGTAEEGSAHTARANKVDAIATMFGDFVDEAPVQAVRKTAEVSKDPSFVDEEEVTEKSPAPKPRSLSSTMCVFRLGGTSFALDTSLVSEVFLVDRLTPVPLAKPHVLGLFSLRGTPVSLVDLKGLLCLGDGAATEIEPTAERPAIALVLRTKSTLVGGLIDRVDLILSAGKGIFSDANSSTEHAAVSGFLELTGFHEGTATVLRDTEVSSRIDALRIRQA